MTKGNFTIQEGYNLESSKLLYNLIKNLRNEKSFIEKIEYLLQNGADPNVTSSDKKALIYVVIDKLALEEIGFNDILMGIVLEKILAAGADIEKVLIFPIYNALGYAIAKKVDIPILKLLIDYGADINKPCDKHNMYPFELAIRLGNGKIIKFLIENGVKDCPCKSDSSLLSLAEREQRLLPKTVLDRIVYNSQVEEIYNRWIRFE